MRACLGCCWSRQASHAIHSTHSCGNTLVKASTQVTAQEECNRMYNFTGLIPPQLLLIFCQRRNPADSNTIITPTIMNALSKTQPSPQRSYYILVARNAFFYCLLVKSSNAKISCQLLLLFCGRCNALGNHCIKEPPQVKCLRNHCTKGPRDKIA